MSSTKEQASAYQRASIEERQRGNYRRALQLGQQAVTAARMNSSNRNLLGSALRDYGRAYADWAATIKPGEGRDSKIESAFRLYNESLEVFKGISGSSAEETAATWSFIALATYSKYGYGQSVALWAVESLLKVDNADYLVSAIIVALRIVPRSAERSKLAQLGRDLTVKGSANAYRRRQVVVAQLFGDRCYRLAMRLTRGLRR